jgi:cytochrome c-type biogenesis protein CcmE
VVPESIIEESGRPVQFEVQGEDGGRTLINYDGVVPGLFGPMAFVIVEGRAVSATELDGDRVIIRHEDEFYSETPPEGSISRYYVPTPTADDETDGAP